MQGPRLRPGYGRQGGAGLRRAGHPHGRRGRPSRRGPARDGFRSGPDGVTLELPKEASRNTAGRVLEALIRDLGLPFGFSLRLRKGLALSSGMGGSAAYSVGDDEHLAQIKRRWERSGYLICPHTAAADRVYGERLAGRPAIVVATAHPAKF